MTVKKPYPKQETKVTKITAEQAKEILGWQEEPEGKSFGNDYQLHNTEGKKVRTNNNLTNRPISVKNLEKLQQEIGRKRFKLNGETIVVGKSGYVLSGQHRLAALILAQEKQTKDKNSYPLWKTNLFIESVLVLGIDEKEEVVNTIDTGKPRNLTDVIYRSHYFKKMPARDRKNISRITDYAIKFFWDRTGRNNDSISLIRTHAESLQILEDHSKLLEAVKFVYDEDCKFLENYISLGTVAALIYLMGSSETLSVKYYEGTKTEKDLTFDLWSTACDYFTLLNSQGEQVKEVIDKLDKLRVTEDGVPVRERNGYIVAGWEGFSNNGKVTSKDLILQFEKDAEGFRMLISDPTVGGIDLGDEDYEPSEEAVEAEKEKLKKEKQASLYWIKEEDGNHWQAELLKRGKEVSLVRVAEGYASAGEEYEVQTKQLQKKQPPQIVN